MANLMTRAQIEALLNDENRPFDTFPAAEQLFRYYFEKVFPELKEMDDMGAVLTRQGMDSIIRNSEAYIRGAIRHDRAKRKQLLKR